MFSENSDTDGPHHNICQRISLPYMEPALVQHTFCKILEEVF